MTDKVNTYNLRQNPMTTEKAKNTKKAKRNRSLSTTRDSTETTTENMFVAEDREMTEHQLQETDSTTLLDIAAQENNQQSPEETGLEDNPLEGNSTPEQEQDQTTLILKLLQQLNQQQTSLKEEIKQQQTSLKEEIKQQQTNLDKKLEQQQISIETKIAGQQQQQTEQMETLKENLFEEIREILSQRNHFLTETIAQNTAELRTQITESSEQTLVRCEEKIQEQTTSLKKEIQKQLKICETNTRTCVRGVREDTLKLTNTVTENTETLRINKEKIETINKNISSVEKRTTSLETKLENLSLNDITNSNSNHQQPMEIYVNCPGTSNLIESNLPKFNGRSRNPIDFLVKFKSYYKKLQGRRIPEGCPTFEDILQNILTDHAGRWWQIVKEEIHTLEEFERMFLNKYWNMDIQNGVKRRIGFERYFENGSLTRAEYFIERVVQLRNMNPPMAEEEIVNMLSDQFCSKTQDARRCQNIRSIHAFEQLLSRFDIEESNCKLKINMNQKPTHNRSNSNNHNQNSTLNSNNNNQNIFNQPEEKRIHNNYRNYRQYSNNNYNRSRNEPAFNGRINHQYSPGKMRTYNGQQLYQQEDRSYSGLRDERPRNHPYQSYPPPRSNEQRRSWDEQNNRAPINGDRQPTRPYPQQYNRPPYSSADNRDSYPTSYPTNEQINVCRLVATDHSRSTPNNQWKIEPPLDTQDPVNSIIPVNNNNNNNQTSALNV